MNGIISRAFCLSKLFKDSRVLLIFLIQLFAYQQVDAFVQEDIIEQESFTIVIDDCNGMGEVCLEIPQGDTPNYSFTVNGGSYTAMIGGCDFDTTYAYSYANLPGMGSLGPYNLDSWFVNGVMYSAEFQDMFELVDSMNVWDSTGNWMLEPMSFLIVGGDPSKDYSVMNITTILISSPNIIGFNLGLQPKGATFFFETGSNEFIITNNLSGCSDTVDIEIVCIETDFHDYTLEIGETDSHCLDFSELPGNVLNVSNITVPEVEPSVTYDFISGNSCLEFTGVAAGMDTVCIVFCDDMGFCDTTKINITVNPSDFLENIVEMDVQVYQDEMYCFDITKLPGGIISMELSCEGPESHVDFAINNIENFCVDFTGMSLGTDEVCFDFEDDEGNILRTKLIVNVLPPEPEYLDITIDLGMDYEDCFDISEIFGYPTEIYNDCPLNTQNSVIFTINDISLCLEAEGIAVGTDTICVVFCDANGVCDLVLYRISVVDNTVLNLPVANDDQQSTAYNTDITLEVCGNDAFGSLDVTSFSVLSTAQGASGPLNGTIELIEDCQVLYSPNEDFCGEDSFEYIVCNEDGCDGAIVNITIECPSTDPEAFEVFTAFSPNNDGINDTFKITGLANFPGSKLDIFNRWGQRIYSAIDYDNSWNGIWNNGFVTDGTFYYVLKLERNNVKSGYIQISR